MKVFFDTSALFPVFVREHPHHERSFAVFSAIKPKSAACAAHTLAELYSTLTRLPGPERVSGAQALLFIEALADRFKVVVLDSSEYLSAIRKAADCGVYGGMLYDALIAECALKEGAETLYTWNVRHFQSLGPEVARIVKTP